MRAFNPVREGLKKHPTAHAYYLTLKERAKNGLTAIEWDWYSARQKEFEPEVYAAEQQAARRSNDMDGARRLSVEDLQAILAEKAGEDLQVWLRHGRIGTGRGYEAEVERAKAIEASAVSNGERS